MHELSLLVSVVDAATKAAAGAGARAIESVTLRVGARSGVDADALASAWPLAVAGSVAEDARLVLESVPAAVWCPRCEAEVEIDRFFALRCPVCDEPTGMLVRGREFEVAEIEIDVAAHD